MHIDMKTSSGGISLFLVADFTQPSVPCRKIPPLFGGGAAWDGGTTCAVFYGIDVARSIISYMSETLPRERGLRVKDLAKIMNHFSDT